MKKSVWISTLNEKDTAAAALAGKLSTYGIECYGQPWEKGLDKMPWFLIRTGFQAAKPSAWLIIAGEEDLQDDDLRYSLSLTALGVKNDEPGLPIVIVHPAPAHIEESLPFPLGGAKILPPGDPSLGAKMTAAVHTPAKQIQQDYRLNVLGDPHIGVWLEAGPKNGEWKGAFWGIKGGEILFQAVGPKGCLPDKTVLEHAMQGMKIAHQGSEYTAWAVHNAIDNQSSHFVKILGPCDSILFGELAGDDTTEAYVVPLK